MGRAVLACFDLDNTLLDRQLAYRSWAQAFVAARGLDAAAFGLLVELDRDGFATREEVFGPARRLFGLEESVADLIAAYRVDYFAHIAPVPEVAAGLARLRSAKVRVALVTNGPPSQYEKLARAGLADSFDAVCVSDVLGVRKPDRAIFAAAAESCGTSLSALSRGFMVGDSLESDIAGGRGAGLETIWIARGRSLPEGAPAPDTIVDGPLEAIASLLHQVERVAPS